MFEDDVSDGMLLLGRRHNDAQLVTHLDVHVIDGRDVTEDHLDVSDVEQGTARLTLVLDLFLERLEQAMSHQ